MRECSIGGSDGGDKDARYVPQLPRKISQDAEVQSLLVLRN
jgi:hypothetical protein